MGLSVSNARAAVLGCALVCSAAHSQTPRQAPSVGASAALPSVAASAPADPRGTAAQPLVVRSVESDADAQDKAAQASTRQREATRDVWLVLFAGLTVLVAAAQAIMFLRQLRLMKDTLADTRVAADAARSTGEGNRLAQRAWVACLGTGSEIGHDITEVRANGEETLHPWGVGIRLSWQNVGYTPALDVTTSVKLQVYRAPFDQELPPPAPPPFPPGSITQLAPRAPPIYSSPQFVFPADIALLAQEQCRIFIFGRIEYATLFNRNDRRHTLVCFEAVFAGYLNNQHDRPRLQFRVIGPHNTAT